MTSLRLGNGTIVEGDKMNEEIMKDFIRKHTTTEHKAVWWEKDEPLELLPDDMYRWKEILRKIALKGGFPS